MNTDELRNLDSEKLQSQLKEHYEELFNLRFQQVMGKLTASGRPRIVKREISPRCRPATCTARASARIRMPPHAAHGS